MNLLGFIIWIIVGAIVGAVAGNIMGSKGGLLRDIICGILGGFVGGFIHDLLPVPEVFTIPFFNVGIISLVFSVVGACIVIYIAKLLKI